MVELMWSYMPVALPAKAVTEVTITRKIRLTMRPYSMAVAPLSSARKRFR